MEKISPEQYEKMIQVVNYLKKEGFSKEKTVYQTFQKERIYAFLDQNHRFYKLYKAMLHNQTFPRSILIPRIDIKLVKPLYVSLNKRQNYNQIKEAYQKQPQKVKSKQSQKYKSYKNIQEQTVGLMVESIKQHKKKLKSKNQKFKPYKLIDQNNLVNDNLIKKENYPSHIRSKMQQFYNTLKEFKVSDINFQRKVERDKAQEQRSRTRDKQNYIQADNMINEKVDTLYNNSGRTQQQNNEMGITRDGRSQRGFSTSERTGIGRTQADMFTSFRKQKSFNYHIFAEQRANKVEDQELCFICSKPGHIARNCKFGLT